MYHIVFDKYSYTTLHMKYPETTSPDTILDHAFTTSLALATHRDPNECDPHLAVSVSVSANTNVTTQEDASAITQETQTQATQAQNAGEISVVVARLWRSKAQAMQLAPKVPNSSLDSKQFESMAKERVANFQGLDNNVWSASLGLQLRIINCNLITY